MSTRLSSLIVLMLAAVLASACAGPAIAGPGETGDSTPAAPTEGGGAGTPVADPTAGNGQTHGGPVADFEGLIQNLLVTGAPVEATEERIEQPFFSVPARLVRFNGSDLQVFENASEADADAEVALVSPDGGSVGTSMMMWMATPHFFKAGRFIVLYLGDDAATLGMLEGALGAQFAGGAVEPAEADGLPAACQPGSADAVQYANPKMGYCLLHPARFGVNVVEAASVLVEGPAVGEGPQPVRAGVSITVTPAQGRGLPQVVDEVVSEFSGLPITRAPGTLGGEAAEVVEGLPGVTGSREIFAVHDDNVYRLRFTPVDSAFPQVAPDVAELWETVTASFAFLP